jgi:hypothetical protein
MTDWFRSWHGAPTDPKWLAIARKAKTSPGFVIAVAWALLDRASQARPRGSIDGFDADAMAAFMGCDEAEVLAIIQAMSDRGVIVDGRFAAWEARQPDREDGSADRARTWRERKRTQANASERNRPTEADTDTEKKEEGDKQAISATTARLPATPAPVANDDWSRIESRFAAAMGDLAPCDVVFGPMVEECRKHGPDAMLEKALAIQRSDRPCKRWSLLATRCVEEITRPPRGRHATDDDKNPAIIANRLAERLARERGGQDHEGGGPIIELFARHA